MEIRQVVIHQHNTCYPGILRIPEHTPAPAIVFHNGYCAYMEMYDGMAQALCQAGYVTLQYDGQNMYGRDSGYFRCGTQWLEDAAAGVSYVMGLSEVDRDRVGFAGVSMGGAITITQGSFDPRLKCLYAMAPVPSWGKLMESFWTKNRGAEAWQAFVREMEEDASRCAQGFPSRFVDAGYGSRGIPSDPEADAAELALHPHKASQLPLDSLYNSYMYVDSVRAARNVTIPLCIVQGTADDVVPAENAQVIFDAAATAHKELHFIEGAGHVLPEEVCDAVSRLAVSWFDRWLK